MKALGDNSMLEIHDSPCLAEADDVLGVEDVN
jgi:hypothetical protein